MGIFESIKNAIFGHGAATPGAATPGVATPAPGATPAATAAAPTSALASAAPPKPSPASSADINAMLATMNAKSAQKLNWQTSIVDLMKLVGLDPSLANRKQLAQELGYTGDTADSASMNIWLHKQVMDKLAQSGGQVPASLRA